MKKTTTLIAAALVLAACAETDPAQEFRDALPKAEAIQLGTPQAEGTTGALVVRRDPLGDTALPQSEYAVMSYYLALSMNGGVGWTLAFLHYVTLFPPTSVNGDTATWGPWLDDQGLNRWKLEVRKVGESYEYVLSGQPGSDAAAPFVDLITGVAVPADEDHGTGSFVIDFDAQDALDHGTQWVKHDFGRLAVDYDNTAGVTIGAVFTGARNSDPADPHFLNAAYSFEDSANGGELQVAFERLDTTATVSLRTRWRAGGAGRADAHFDGPDGQGGRVTYFASECWAGHAQDFAEVYDSKHPEIPALADESLCSPFSSASYADIALP